jgi:hypothetical protein
MADRKMADRKMAEGASVEDDHQTTNHRRVISN